MNTKDIIMVTLNALVMVIVIAFIFVRLGGRVKRTKLPHRAYLPPFNINKSLNQTQLSSI